MVYPDDYSASTEGSRDVIDGTSDVSVPFVLLVRHGSSDHLQPHFPTPGQIRSMFNTSKINDRPEYASSPSTMSDPIEWRPNNQIEMLEERLMRIHQWNDNTSYLNRPYEGQGVTINDMNQSVVATYDNDFVNGQLIPEPRNRDPTFSYNDRPKIDACDNEYETHSELSGQSERLVEDTDADCNHREYDVEEYVEQINQYVDGSENSSNEYLSNTNHKAVQSSSMELKSLDSELFERQKHLEKLFNLDIKEVDNEFISELKTVLLEKLKNYFSQKNENNKCSLTDDIRKVAEILNRAITDKDSVICDKVHELCLRLRDILVLKDEILNNSLPDEAKNDLGLRSSFNNSEACEISPTGSDNATNGAPRMATLRTTERSETPETLETPETPDTPGTPEYGNTRKKFQAEFKEKVSNEKITMIHTYKENEPKPDSPNVLQKESFESLIKFSRIPVPKSKLPKPMVNVVYNQGNSQSRVGQKVSITTSKIPAPATGMKRLMNTEPKDNHGHVNKRVTTRYSKDILQQKEEIIRKAALLGLINGIDDMAKIPHLTERAQLALLEKQIQGKIKSKQLALERKKIGLRDRVSNFRLNSDSTEKMTKHSNVYKVAKFSAMPSQETTSTAESYERTLPNSQSYVKETVSGVEETSHFQTHLRNKFAKQLEEESDERMTSASSQAATDEEEPEPLGSNNNELTSENTHNCFMPTRLSHIVNTEIPREETIDSLQAEETIEDEEVRSDFICKGTLVEDTLVSEEKHKLYEHALDSVSTASQTIEGTNSRLNVVLFILIPVVIILLSLSAYLYKKQVFEYHGYYSVVLKQFWNNITKYNFKGKFTEQFGEVRKYMKRKCELL